MVAGDISTAVGGNAYVKLGTITAEGDAGTFNTPDDLTEQDLNGVIDIYCYICNDTKLDPDLACHLATVGINVQTQTKTEKSMTELVSLRDESIFGV